MIPLLPPDVSTMAAKTVLVGEMPCATDDAFAFADILDELSEIDIDAEETPVFAVDDLILEETTDGGEVQQRESDDLIIDDAPAELLIPEDAIVKHDAISVVAEDAQKQVPKDIGMSKQVVMPKTTVAQSIVEGCIPLPKPNYGAPDPQSIAVPKSSIEQEKQALIPILPKPMARTLGAERFVEAVDNVAGVAGQPMVSRPDKKIDFAPNPDTIFRPLGHELKPSFDTAPTISKTIPPIASELPNLETNTQVIDAESGAFWIPEKGVSQHIQPASSSSIANADTVRHVANQLSVAVTDHAGKPTEIALNPEELGRVRLSMSVVENAITLSISAERQETTDLMRRYIETLAQEFRSLGYSDVSFAFGQDTGSEQSANTDEDVEVDENADTARVADLHTTQMIVTSGLDIRL